MDPLTPRNRIPLIYYGTFEEDKTTKKLWLDAWNQQPTTEESALRMYFAELMAIVQPRLEERDWVVKRQASSCLSAACSKVTLKELDPVLPVLVPLLQKESSGRLWVRSIVTLRCRYVVENVC